VVGQSFRGPKPDHIAVGARRRDGHTLDGGYRHGEFKFSVPLQVYVREAAKVDERLLAGLDSAHVAQAPTTQRLKSARSFVELANTDDDLLTETAESILMGAAFDQMLPGKSTAYNVGKRFGAVFQRFGTVTVAEAKKARPGIEIDESDEERAKAQPQLVGPPQVDEGTLRRSQQSCTRRAT
jgi:hypothetical protein